MVICSSFCGQQHELLVEGCGQFQPVLQRHRAWKRPGLVSNAAVGAPLGVRKSAKSSNKWVRLGWVMLTPLNQPQLIQRGGVFLGLVGNPHFWTGTPENPPSE